MQTRSYPWLPAAVLALALTAMTLNVRAAEKSEATANPNGTWKWTFTPPNADPIALSVKLKLDGEKLTGTFVGRDGTESPVKDGKFKGNEVSFTVVRERDGNQFIMKYAGKITGDTIKGTTETERDGQTRSREWEAKRGVDPAGTWKWSYGGGDGQTVEVTLKLKSEGDKLTGTVTWNTGGEAKIAEGKFKDGEVAFQVTREREGQKFTTKYHGKLEGDSITGKVDLNFNGEDRSFDWAPKRAKD